MQGTTALYILSAIVQSLAAIFAILGSVLIFHYKRIKDEEDVVENIKEFKEHLNIKKNNLDSDRMKFHELIKRKFSFMKRLAKSIAYELLFFKKKTSPFMKAKKNLDIRDSYLEKDNLTYETEEDRSKFFPKYDRDTFVVMGLTMFLSLLIMTTIDPNASLSNFFRNGVILMIIMFTMSLFFTFASIHDKISEYKRPKTKHDYEKYENEFKELIKKIEPD